MQLVVSVAHGATEWSELVQKMRDRFALAALIPQVTRALNIWMGCFSGTEGDMNKINNNAHGCVHARAWTQHLKRQISKKKRKEKSLQDISKDHSH